LIPISVEALGRRSAHDGSVRPDLLVVGMVYAFEEKEYVFQFEYREPPEWGKSKTFKRQNASAPYQHAFGASTQL
jgi:hypothetical protein